MASPVRCPKCGLVQMSRSVCKSCGGKLSAPPPIVASATPRPATSNRPDPVSPTRPPAVRASAGPLDVAFDRERFLLRQQHLTVHEKYDIWDESGQPILYVERPHSWRNMAVLFLGVLSGLTLAGLLIGGAAGFSKSLPVLDTPPVVVLVFAAAAASLLVLPYLAASRFGRPRHVAFYRDRSRAEKLLEIRQDRVVTLLEHTYTLVGADQQTLAHFRKNLWMELLRKTWYCDAPDGRRLCVAKEDSYLRAFLRRFATNLLPLNFIICRGETDEVLGRFDRKFTLLDRYVLDLSEDPGRALDRRIAIALGVLLDTGERR